MAGDPFTTVVCKSCASHRWHAKILKHAWFIYANVHFIGLSAIV